MQETVEETVIRGVDKWKTMYTPHFQHFYVCIEDIPFVTYIDVDGIACLKIVGKFLASWLKVVAFKRVLFFCFHPQNN